MAPRTPKVSLSDGLGHVIEAIDGYGYHAASMKTRGIRWTRWDILDTERNLQRLHATMVDLKAQGRDWGADD